VRERFLQEEDFDNIVTIAFAAVDSWQQDNKERSQEDICRRRLDQEDMAKMFSMED